jgi:hypothetical protein
LTHTLGKDGEFRISLSDQRNLRAPSTALAFRSGLGGLSPGLLAKSGLHRTAVAVENPLRVAIWLRAALEDQVHRGTKGMAVEVRRHRLV